VYAEADLERRLYTVELIKKTDPRVEDLAIRIHVRKATHRARQARASCKSCSRTGQKVVTIGVQELPLPGKIRCKNV